MGRRQGYLRNGRIISTESLASIIYKREEEKRKETL
jgi:hypothetical protein